MAKGFKTLDAIREELSTVGPLPTPEREAARADATNQKTGKVTIEKRGRDQTSFEGDPAGKGSGTDAEGNVYVQDTAQNTRREDFIRTGNVDRLIGSEQAISPADSIPPGEVVKTFTGETVDRKYEFVAGDAERKPLGEYNLEPGESRAEYPVIKLDNGIEQATKDLSTIKDKEGMKASRSRAQEDPSNKPVPQTPRSRLEVRMSKGKVNPKMARLQHFATMRDVRNRGKDYILSPEDVQDLVESVNMGIAGKNVRSLTTEEIREISPLLAKTNVGKDILRKSSLTLSREYGQFLEIKDNIRTSSQIEAFLDTASTNPLVGTQLRSLIEGLKTEPGGRANAFGKRIAENDKNLTAAVKNELSVKVDFHRNGLPGQEYEEFRDANYRHENGLWEPLSLEEKKVRKKEQDTIKAVKELVGGRKIEDMSKDGRRIILSQMSPDMQKFYREVLSKQDQDGAVEVSAELLAKFNAEVDRIVGTMVEATTKLFARIAGENELFGADYKDALEGLKDAEGNDIDALKRSREDPDFAKRFALQQLIAEIGVDDIIDSATMEVLKDHMDKIREDLSGLDKSLDPAIADAYKIRLAQVQVNLKELADAEAVERADLEKEKYELGEKKKASMNRLGEWIEEQLKKGEGLFVNINREDLSYATMRKDTEYAVGSDAMRQLLEFAKTLPDNDRDNIERILIASADGSGIIGAKVDGTTDHGKMGIPSGVEEYFDGDGSFNPRIITEKDVYDDKSLPAVKRYVDENPSMGAIHAANLNRDKWSDLYFENPDQANTTMTVIGAALRQFTKITDANGNPTGESRLTVIEPDDILGVTLSVAGEDTSLKTDPVRLMVAILKDHITDPGIAETWEQGTPESREAAMMMAVVAHMEQAAAVSRSRATDGVIAIIGGLHNMFEESGEGVEIQNFDQAVEYISAQSVTLAAAGAAMVKSASTGGNDDSFVMYAEKERDADELLTIINFAIGKVYDWNKRIVEEQEHLGLREIRGGIRVGENGDEVRGADPKLVEEALRTLKDSILTIKDEAFQAAIDAGGPEVQGGRGAPKDKTPKAGPRYREAQREVAAEHEKPPRTRRGGRGGPPGAKVEEPKDHGGRTGGNVPPSKRGG